MYARLVRFSFGPGKSAEAQALADEMGHLVAAQPGCQGATVFGDHSDGEYGIFVLWDTADNANAAAGLMRPRLMEHLSGNVQRPPETRLFEVLSA